jgi:hypothetical protein
MRLLSLGLALVTLAGSFASCTGGNVADDTTASEETEAEEQTTLQEDETTLEETTTSDEITTSDETTAEEETTAGNDEQEGPTGDWVFDLKEIVYEMTQNPQKKGSDVEDSLGG